MKKCNLREPLAALSLAVPGCLLPVWAQEGGSLAETVVTAARVEQPLSDVVADVTIVGRDAVERAGAAGLVDLLSRYGGVSFARNGGLGATTNLYLRGSEGNHTAVFVDGVRVDAQSGSGGATLNGIPLSRVDRIEILRGPAAAVYGSDAVAGVIQVFTRQGEEGFAPSVEFGVGNQGTRRLDVGLSGGTGEVDYALGLTREISTGFDVKASVNPDVDGYRSTASSLRLGWKPVAGHRLEFTALDNELDAQYDSSTADNHSLVGVRTMGLNWRASWGEMYSTQLSVGRSRDVYQIRPDSYVTETQVDNYLWLNEWKQGRAQWTVALERRDDRLDNSSTTPSLTGRHQNGLAIGYGIRSGAHTLQVNARHDVDSEFGGQSTGSFAYALALSSAWRATASMGSAFRAPTLYQRFSDAGVASLKPEQSRNFEVGLKHERTGQRFSAVAYRNRVSNLINYVFGSSAGCAGTWGGCYENVGRAEITGLTLEAGRTVAGVSLSAALDWMNPKNLGTGKWLARRARQSARLAAEVQWVGWRWGAELALSGSRFDMADNKKILPGYGVFNLNVSRPLGQDWTLLARVDNLLNKDYELASGYATGGRRVYVGLRWSPH